LSETGYIEGRNVAIEYRWAEGKNERLPEMAADLVSRRVAVIAVLADIAVSAAKAKTMTIPIVFMTGGDPVREGFVASLNQPGGNITGASWFSVDPMAKRLEILHQVVPNAAVIAQLVDLNFQDSVSHVAEVKEAARNFGLQLVVLVSSTANDIDTAFTSLCSRGPVQSSWVLEVFISAGANKSSHWRPTTQFPRFIHFASLPWTVA